MMRRKGNLDVEREHGKWQKSDYYLVINVSMWKISDENEDYKEGEEEGEKKG